MISPLMPAKMGAEECGLSGGMWFDRFELQKVDDPHKSAGEKLLDINRDTTVVVDHNAKLNCPKCEDAIMMRHFFSVKKEVEVDECPKCAGYWLDSGELGRIRNQFNSEEEREHAAQEYFSEVFDVKLTKMKSESDEKRKKTKEIAKIFRFICPSNYISGKQSWGAF
jgi:Zn-finger nucleic acid-binding protein